MPSNPLPHPRRHKRRYTKRTPPEQRRLKHPNWGGPRLGAGARKGNLNALKHGRRSQQMARLAMFLAANPDTRGALFALAAVSERRHQSIEELTEHALFQVLDRGLKVGLDRFGESRLIMLPPREERRAIKNPTHENPPVPTGEEKNHAPVDQDSPADPENPSRSVRETKVD